jgi:hypothetical protein
MGKNIKSFLPSLFIVACLLAGFIWPEYKTANVGILVAWMAGLLLFFVAITTTVMVDSILSRADISALPKESIAFYHKYKNASNITKAARLLIQIVILLLLSLNDAIFTATAYFALLGLSKILVMYTIKTMDDAFAGKPVEGCAGAPKKSGLL